MVPPLGPDQGARAGDNGADGCCGCCGGVDHTPGAPLSADRRGDYDPRQVNAARPLPRWDDVLSNPTDDDAKREDAHLGPARSPRSWGTSHTAKHSTPGLLFAFTEKERGGALGRGGKEAGTTTTTTPTKRKMKKKLGEESTRATWQSAAAA